MGKKLRTPDYRLRANAAYNKKFERITANLPEGTKERIQALTGLSCSAYLVGLALADLDRLEAERAKSSEQEQERGV